MDGEARTERSAKNQSPSDAEVLHSWEMRSETKQGGTGRSFGLPGGLEPTRPAKLGQDWSEGNSMTGNIEAT
jgi:hypothetical protein